MVDERISDGSLGWTIRQILTSGSGGSVTLNDGVTFSSPCVASARSGDIWAVNHEPCAGLAFGQVRQAVLLRPCDR